MAGTDTTLLGLAGAGYADGRSFGFAACERAVGASEGINLVQERRTRRAGSQVGSLPCLCAFEIRFEVIMTPGEVQCGHWGV